jgi:hypothetical protein
MTATTSPIDRAEINRRNARKSTGPRTPEGKDRSRFNALKHGMTAKTMVLPGEDAGVLEQRIDAWTADLQPRNEVEQFLVERSVLSSWQLERADRAELAQLSSRMRAVPDEDAVRHREEAAALGRRLFSDRDLTLEDSIQSQVLSALIPGGKSKTASRPIEVLDHPEAIVLRLESTAAGCRWMLDRWTELRGRLDRGQTWQTDEKVKAIRLLGKRPLDMNPEQWEDHVDFREEVPDPEGDAYFDRRLDRQLDDRLAVDESATIAMLRDVAGRAIARLEALDAGFRERADADAAERSARLSFDASNEAERLRRYQSSCGRALYRSLDTLLKIRRSVLSDREAPPAPAEADAGAETSAMIDFSEDDDRSQADAPKADCEDQSPCGSGLEAISTINLMEESPSRLDPESVGPDPEVTGVKPAPPAHSEDPRNEPTAPPVDRGNPRHKHKARQNGEITRRMLPSRRAGASATILLIILAGWMGSIPIASASPRRGPHFDARGRASRTGLTRNPAPRAATEETRETKPPRHPVGRPGSIPTSAERPETTVHCPGHPVPGRISETDPGRPGYWVRV